MDASFRRFQLLKCCRYAEDWLASDRIKYTRVQGYLVTNFQVKEKEIAVMRRKKIE